ncbi:MAG TPA: chloride channel protein [Thermoanaerobaculia bacterium]|nr:chloride channel protein [Thermoanaerobaculia bacterium]
MSHPLRVTIRALAAGAGRALGEGVAHVQVLAARFLLGTLVLIGALCGVIAVIFHRYVEFAHDLLIGRALAMPGPWRIVLVIVTPTVTFALLAWLIRRFAPRAIGANLARVRRAYNENPRLLGARTVGATFVATPLSLGAGAPLGPEGPITVVASGFSVAVARLLRLPQKAVRAMIPIGTAAGISAIFNTPITGVVFALEEVIGTSQKGILGGVLVGSVAALEEASRRGAYTITDRSTFEAARATNKLVPILQRSPLLHHHIEMLLARGERRHRNAEWFVQWVMSHRGRDIVERHRFDGARRWFVTER